MRMILNRVQPAGQVTRQHIIEILKQIKGCEPASIVSLPGGWCSRREYTKLIIVRKMKEDFVEFCYPIDMNENQYYFDAIGLTLKIVRLSVSDIKEVKTDPMTALLDADSLQGSLVVRSRQPGDMFCPLGQRKAQKLKNFFIHQKIHRYKRHKIALLAQDKIILWVMGIRIADSVKVDKHTKSIIKIEASGQTD